MATRMLIDARHSEETRVAVLKGNRIEEFDFESAEHRQIKGNIYLAKVTRVEPSLQAAFVDFGGNRHGFLAFSEIHPDYYQIPAADRQALLAEEAQAAEEEERIRAEQDENGEPFEGDDDAAHALDDDDSDGVEEIDTSDKDHVATIEEGQMENGDDQGDADEDGEPSSEEGDADEDAGGSRRASQGRNGRGNVRNRAKAMDDAREKRLALRRRYKIQDVIQRRQVLLVQVVKEERGNKGAALTTYLSLAGRYTVLMPNSSHGGGISRKISSASDRKRLKQVVSDLSLPKSMGLIVRTAGLSRTKTEIKRDFDYLARLWDDIRENTLGSTAPSLIHSDSDLIKRAIRDLYNREIEEVMVEGEEGYLSAKAFMKMLMPSHARRVKSYADPVPLFQRYGAEEQLKAMYDPVVQLKSGGYLVINPTEALVSIDINSGRSTKEHSIERTAFSTNIEAAQEIARQLRLRDMAGLVVIDFIDMERSNNIRKVERCMKDSLKSDRARIQVGRISSFGLMEMSRQRLRTGVLEATTRTCPHCDGTGLVRTASSAGLSALRLIEEEAGKGRGSQITLSASTEAAVYLLNAKRSDLQDIERRYGVSIEVLPEGEDEGAKMSVSSAGPRPTQKVAFERTVDPDEEEDFDAYDEDEEAADTDLDNADDEQRGKKRRRRRGGRSRSGGEGRDQNDASSSRDQDTEHNASDRDEQKLGGSDEGDEGRPKRRRRGGRGRSGNRNRTNGQDQSVGQSTPSDEQLEATAENLEPLADQVVADMAVVAGPDDAPETAEQMAAEKPAKPRRKRASAAKANNEAADNDDDAKKTEDAKPVKRRSRKKAEPAAEQPNGLGSADTSADDGGANGTSGKQRGTTPRPAGNQEDAAQAKDKNMNVDAQPQDQVIANDVQNDSEGQSARRGWWQRTFGN